MNINLLNLKRVISCVNNFNKLFKGPFKMAFALTYLGFNSSVNKYIILREFYI